MVARKSRTFFMPGPLWARLKNEMTQQTVKRTVYYSVINFMSVASDIKKYGGDQKPPKKRGGSEKPYE